MTEQRSASASQQVTVPPRGLGHSISTQHLGWHSRNFTPKLRTSSGLRTVNSTSNLHHAQPKTNAFAYGSSVKPFNLRTPGMTPGTTTGVRTGVVSHFIGSAHKKNFPSSSVGPAVKVGDGQNGAESATLKSVSSSGATLGMTGAPPPQSRAKSVVLGGVSLLKPSPLLSKKRITPNFHTYSSNFNAFGRNSTEHPVHPTQNRPVPQLNLRGVHGNQPVDYEMINRVYTAANMRPGESYQESSITFGTPSGSPPDQNKPRGNLDFEPLVTLSQGVQEPNEVFPPASVKPTTDGMRNLSATTATPAGTLNPTTFVTLASNTIAQDGAQTVQLLPTNNGEQNIAVTPGVTTTVTPGRTATVTPDPYARKGFKFVEHTGAHNHLKAQPCENVRRIASTDTIHTTLNATLKSGAELRKPSPIPNSAGLFRSPVLGTRTTSISFRRAVLKTPNISANRISAMGSSNTSGDNSVLGNGQRSVLRNELSGTSSVKALHSVKGTQGDSSVAEESSHREDRMPAVKLSFQTPNRLVNNVESMNVVCAKLQQFQTENPPGSATSSTAANSGLPISSGSKTVNHPLETSKLNQFVGQGVLKLSATPSTANLSSKASVVPTGKGVESSPVLWMRGVPPPNPPPLYVRNPEIGAYRASSPDPKVFCSSPPVKLNGMGRSCTPNPQMPPQSKNFIIREGLNYSASGSNIALPVAGNTLAQHTMAQKSQQPQASIPAENFSEKTQQQVVATTAQFSSSPVDPAYTLQVFPPGPAPQQVHIPRSKSSPIQELSAELKSLSAENSAIASGDHISSYREAKMKMQKQAEDLSRMNSSSTLGLKDGEKAVSNEHVSKASSKEPVAERTHAEPVDGQHSSGRANNESSNSGRVSVRSQSGASREDSGKQPSIKSAVASANAVGSSNNGTEKSVIPLRSGSHGTVVSNARSNAVPSHTGSKGNSAASKQNGSLSKNSSEGVSSLVPSNNQAYAGVTFENDDFIVTLADNSRKSLRHETTQGIVSSSNLKVETVLNVLALSTLCDSEEIEALSFELMGFARTENVDINTMSVTKLRHLVLAIEEHAGVELSKELIGQLDENAFADMGIRLPGYAQRQQAKAQASSSLQEETPELVVSEQPQSIEMDGILENTEADEQQNLYSQDQYIQMPRQQMRNPSDNFHAPSELKYTIAGEAPFMDLNNDSLQDRNSSIECPPQGQASSSFCEHKTPELDGYRPRERITTPMPVKVNSELRQLELRCRSVCAELEREREERQRKEQELVRAKEKMALLEGSTGKSRFDRIRERSAQQNQEALQGLTKVLAEENEKYLEMIRKGTSEAQLKRFLSRMQRKKKAFLDRLGSLSRRADFDVNGRQEQMLLEKLSVEATSVRREMVMQQVAKRREALSR